MPSESRLSIVGLGPGGRGQMTKKALRAIRSSKFVVGYRPYLDLIPDLLEGKEAVPGSMGKEVERAKAAVDLLDEGSVALVSSGDPNIYGMAGLGLEVASDRVGPDRIDVIPGVTSFTAAACRAGVVFRESVAVISLSDLLTPWERIERRLKLAAKMGIPTAIYNPRSRKRDHQLRRALDIFGHVPALVAKNVRREGEEIFWTDSSRLLAGDIEKVDMFTLLILGGRGMISPPDVYGTDASGTNPPDALINIVGIGPGSPDQITLEAEETLKSSSKVFGPSRYIGAVREIAGGDLVSHIGPCEQRMAQRLHESREAALRGERASILAGGDPSIFSSAWRVLEGAGSDPVCVVPGISAFSAVAAKAGAPLVNDFILLSKTPAPEDLRAMMGEGFGAAIYNVAGEDLPSILREIPAERPCVLARDVDRDGETAMVMTAGDLADAGPCGSRFTLLAASDNSYIMDGRIIARRGYQKKYSY